MRSHCCVSPSQFLLDGLRDHLGVCLSPLFFLLSMQSVLYHVPLPSFLRLTRLSCCVTSLSMLDKGLSASPPPHLNFSFSLQSVSYQRKVGG
jgi:hypothetical protein